MNQMGISIALKNETQSRDSAPAITMLDDVPVPHATTAFQGN
jgi:hypothetical protein